MNLFIKRSFGLLLTVFFLLSMVSCSQEDEFYQETEQIPEYKVVGEPEQAKLGKIFWDSIKNDYDCNYDEKGNCLPLVVIVGKRIELMQTFETYIEKGAKGVSDYFTKGYWKELFPVLEQQPEKLDALCSGDYYVHRIGDNGNGAFYIATPNEDPLNWDGNILVFRLQVVK